MKTHHHKSTADAATHVTPVALRVPFQRRHAFAGLDVPDLERVVARPRHDAPPVRKHGDALDLRRSQIITKVQWTPQRTQSECPSSVATHLPVATSQTLISPLSMYSSSLLESVRRILTSAPEQETTRRPSGNTATPMTYDEARSSQKYSGRRNTRRSSALPASPRISPSPRPRP